MTRIGSKGRQGTAKGRPRGAKVAPRRPKRSPRWRQEGHKGGQMRPLGAKRSEKGSPNRCQGGKNTENIDFTKTLKNLGFPQVFHGFHEIRVFTLFPSLEPISEPFFTSFRPQGRHIASLGPLLAPSGAPFGPPWDHFGTPWPPFFPHFE